ncbi:MAG: hypothetical protein ABL864_12970 [Terricaulis sp.]
MFGFKARARARAATEAAEISAARVAVHQRMSAYLAQVLAEFDQGEPYASCAYDMQLGLDAVLLNGAEVFGPEIEAAGEHVSAGAMLAGAALGTAIFTRSTEHPKYIADMRFVMSKLSP